MGYYRPNVAPIEAYQYAGSKASAAEIATAVGEAVSWDKGRMFVSTHEGQRTPGRGDYVMVTADGPVVLDRADFEAQYTPVSPEGDVSTEPAVAEPEIVIAGEGAADAETAA